MILTSKRLSAIVEWIYGDVLADIGCDHAYVATKAVLENKVSKAYACDIAQGPLENAKKTISSHGLEDKIQCLLMDGIQGLPMDVDVVVIAGMGAKTIEEILDKGNLNHRRFLLMPHKDADSLRQYCKDNHLIIQRERMIFEDHYYPLIEVFHDDSKEQELSQKEILYGIHVINDATYREFLMAEHKKWSALTFQIPEEKRYDALQRLEILNTLL